MARYLIHHNQKGRIIEVAPGTPSEEYGKMQMAFAAEAGKDPMYPDNLQIAEMVQLWDDQNIGGVYYDWALAGPDGASFMLIKLPTTTKEQVEAARAKIRRDRDVVRMGTLHIHAMI